MRCSILFFLFFYLILQRSYAQDNLLVINGKVVNNEKAPLDSCTLRIWQPNSIGILNYVLTKSSSEFSINVRPKASDSIYVSVVKKGYMADTIKQEFSFWKSLEGQIVFSLEKEPVTLGEVKIKPVHWKNGDTTFFSADAYKKNADLKLIDLIVRVPGFSLDNQGNLTYQNKIVGRIKIDGEDLLSDKPILLLNSFPIHVLEDIQLLENQTDNKTLKGLTGERKMELNLALKKTKVQFSFGDAKVGIGSLNQYQVNSTLFSFLGKIKTAFITKYNTIGDAPPGLESWQDPTIMFLIASQSRLINSNFISRVEGLPPTYFIRNNLFDSRVKLNFKHSKKISSALETNITASNIRQNLVRESLLFTSTSTIQRKENSLSQAKPNNLFFRFNQIVDISTKAKLELKADLYINNEFNSESNFFNINGVLDSGFTGLKNRINTYSVGVEYNKRQNENLGYSIKAYTHLGNFTQNLMQQSNSLNTTLPLTAYDFTNYEAANNQRLNKHTINYERYKRLKNKRLLSVRMNFVSQYATIRPSVLYIANRPVSYDTLIPELSANGIYGNSRIDISSSYSFKFLKQAFTLKTMLGYDRFNIFEMANRRRLNAITFKTEIGQRLQFKKMSLEYEMAFRTDPPSYENLYQITLPAGINYFKSGYLQEFNFPAFSISPRVSFSQKSILKNFALTPFLSWKYRSLLYTQQLKGFTFFSSPSVTNNTSYNHNLYLFYAGFLKPIKLSVSSSAAIFLSNSYFEIANKVVENALVMKSYEIDLKRRQTKNYNIGLVLGLLDSKRKPTNKTDSSLSGISLKQYNVSLIQTLTVFKSINLDFKSRFVTVKSNQASVQKFYYGDVKAFTKIPKSKLALEATCQNIFNAKTYITFIRGALNQSITTIPLKGRLYMLSLNLNF